MWSPDALLPGPHLCCGGIMETEALLLYVLSGIRRAANPLCDRVGVPDLENTTAEDCKNWEQLTRAPGA